MKGARGDANGGKRDINRHKLIFPQQIFCAPYHRWLVSELFSLRCVDAGKHPSIALESEKAS